MYPFCYEELLLCYGAAPDAFSNMPQICGLHFAVLGAGVLQLGRFRYFRKYCMPHLVRARANMRVVFALTLHARPATSVGALDTVTLRACSSWFQFRHNFVGFRVP